MSENTTTQKYDDVPYDPNKKDSVEAFWNDPKTKIRKGRDKQKTSTKQQFGMVLNLAR